MTISKINKDGNGTMIYQTGEKYIGEFKDDVYEGKGFQLI
jgi:hypothetical protein